MTIFEVMKTKKKFTLKGYYQGLYNGDIFKGLHFGVAWNRSVGLLEWAVNSRIEPAYLNIINFYGDIFEVINEE